MRLTRFNICNLNRLVSKPCMGRWGHFRNEQMTRSIRQTKLEPKWLRGQTWASRESTLAIHVYTIRINPGFILVSFCFHSGLLLVPFWFQSGYMLVSIWFHSGFVLVAFWFCSGFILVSFWSHSGFILVSFRFYSGSTLVSFWFHSGFILICLYT